MKLPHASAAPVPVPPTGAPTGAGLWIRNLIGLRGEGVEMENGQMHPVGFGSPA